MISLPLPKENGRVLRRVLALLTLMLCLRLPAFTENTAIALLQVKKKCRTGSSLPTLSALSAAVRARPKDPELLSCLGKVNAALGDKAAAIDAYKKSLVLDPKNVGLWLRLGILQRKTLEAAPANQTLRLGFIETMLHTGPESELENEIDRFLQLSSVNEELELTRLLISNSRFDRAQSILFELRKLDPVPVDAHAELGLIFMEKEDFENAVIELALAAKAEPKSSQYTLALSEALLRWHHYSTALTFLQAVRADFGALPQFRYDLAYSYYGLRDLDSAISTLTALLTDQPSYAPARFLLGNCYLAKGDLGLAEKWLRSAVAADRTKSAYYVSLAQVKRYQGNVTQALAIVQKALALEPADTEALFESALCHEKRGDLAIAQGELERIVAKQPGLTKAHRALARVYGRLGNSAAAEGEQQKLAQLENQTRTPEEDTQGNR